MKSFVNKLDKFFVALGKFIGIVLPMVAFYGAMIYYAVKFFEATDTLTTVKIGFAIIGILQIITLIPSLPCKKFKLGKWKITIGSNKTE